MDDVDALTRELDAGMSLPASWYTDPAVAALERDRIFRRGWQYVTRLAFLRRSERLIVQFQKLVLGALA